MSSIGKLRHRVQIQAHTETPSGSHYTVKKWTTIATVSARIVAVDGYVTLDTKQINEKITHKILIRYRPYVTTENWILNDSRRFKIRTIKNIDDRNRWLELFCEEDSIALELFETGDNASGDPLRELVE